MLHSKVYTKSMTADLNKAVIERNASFFKAEIKNLCAIIAKRDEKITDRADYDEVLTRLHLCLSFYDSLMRHGETVKLINDMVNF